MERRVSARSPRKPLSGLYWKAVATVCLIRDLIHLIEHMLYTGYGACSVTQPRWKVMDRRIRRHGGRLTAGILIETDSGKQSRSLKNRVKENCQLMLASGGEVNRQIFRFFPVSICWIVVFINGTIFLPVVDLQNVLLPRYKK